ncbi:hypothetical protein FRB90_005182, partial [Tulasnella sp. 427]
MVPLADGHTAQDIQNHLYHAFLHRATTDICIHVHARDWNLAYDLHRVVLIQSGFFRSLFTRGFRESSFRPTSPSSLDQLDVIDVRFDDPNITRAAFEICIARLYGGGPALHLSPSLTPSTSQPLTPTFLTPPTYTPPPTGKHPATPRFLLSLIATSIYLSIPSITSYALSLILTSIGPSTVIRYLNFALAKGIGEAGPGDLPSVVGLEEVGRVMPAQSGVSASARPSNAEADSETGTEGTDSEDASSRKHSRGPDTLERTFSSSTVMPVGSPEPDMHFDYGVVGNKIGEACASWLARWAAEILPFEEAYHNALILGVKPSSQVAARSGPSSAIVNHSRGTRPASNSTGSAIPFNPTLASVQAGRRATISTATAEPITPTPIASSRSHLLSPGSRPPPIWSRNGGLTARWVRGLISSDDFFVHGGEKERYDFATKVVEMRRREVKLVSALEESEGEVELDEEEEAEWETLFRTGFYYSHMSFDDLQKIRNDRSAMTGQPFVPLHVLKSAHWNQAVFRSQVMSMPSVGSPRSSSPNARNGRNSESSPPGSSLQSEIPSNVTLLDTTDIVALTSDSTVEIEDTEKGYFPVFGDGSQKVGGDITKQQVDEIAREAASSDDLAMPNARPNRRLDHTNFFGLALNGRKTGKAIAEARGDYAATAKWTENEPCRFSVEFWGVENLKPSHRLYSQTFWCMGSLWNVYVQIVRKKGLQLGVYLQRQSFVDS